MWAGSELSYRFEPHDHIWSRTLPAATTAVYMLDGGVGEEVYPGWVAGWGTGRGYTGYQPAGLHLRLI